MLKIIWFSTVPYSSVGYGNATREILRRFRKDGNQVILATKHALGGSIEVDGVTCFDGGSKDLINIVQKEEGYDYIVTMCDDWVFPSDFSFNKWVNCCFLDTHKMHPKLLASAKRAMHTIAMTKFTESELKKGERECFYAPLGVTTSTFKPNEEYRKEFRAARNWTDDTFVIGGLGLNYNSDRKNFIGLLRAFKLFHDRHPDSILYLHTDVLGNLLPGVPLKWVMHEMEFKDDGTGPIQYVSQKPYHLWNLSEEAVIRTFNSFDVFCFPTMGEGFGMPIIEAQSCGVPAIVTDTTSCKELLKGGWLIDCEERDLEFSSLGTWIMRAAADKILDKLELAYEAWKSGKIKEIGAQARKGVLEYDWDLIYKEHWKPIFDYLDLEKQGKVFKIETYPKYKELYDGFGSPYELASCEDFEHDKVCQSTVMPRLPNEPEDDSRPLLIRSYPIFPNSSGELYVHTKCAVHSYLAPKFIKQCKNIWREVLSYPTVRKELNKLWEERVKDNPEYIKLSDTAPVFDENYSNTMQNFIKTNFKITPAAEEFIRDCNSFVDIGCGEGELLNDLKEIKQEAIIKGTEINKVWIDGERIVYGDILDLPFTDGEFDCVCSIDVLEHITEPRKALAELFRVAKKKVMICVTPVDNPCFDQDITHIVEWPFIQWQREINEFGNIIAYNPDNRLGVFLVEKR
jgi:glycosyltransferase involved in cell wall biosynthesis/ubiquinone/menaquinone biosynthesis C-methylase UbiE